MKKRKKVFLAGVMAVALLCSGFFGVLPMSVYAQGETVSDTTSEVENDDAVANKDVSDDEKNDSVEESEKSAEATTHIAIEKSSKSDPSAVADDVVARVGEAEYSSLADAISSINDEGTVTIVSDVELSDTISIPSNVKVTLTSDEKAHSITMASTRDTKYQSAFVVEEQGGLIIDSENLTITREKFDENLSGLILCHGSLELKNGTLDGNGNVINSQTSNKKYSAGLVQVCGSSATFTMNGGTIENAIPLQYAGGVRVCCDGKFYMKDGIITEVKNNGQLAAGAVLVYTNRETSGSAFFEMDGGIIENNTGYRGGGVCVVGSSDTYRATMVMNAGKIQKNICTGWTSTNSSFQAAGAGIYIEANAEVTMNGGEISNNDVNGGLGGAVATVDGYYSLFGADGGPEWPIERYSKIRPASFTMNGGTISGNKVTMDGVGGDGGCGGGIYSSSNTVTLKGGVIENNEAERQGGGVYVGSVPYQLTIYDAVVTGNEATILGGGVWACPTGDTEVFVTNGVGIYDNTSEGAGDDVVSVKRSQASHVLTLADRMLGGGQVLWYKDGGIASGEDSLGDPDNSERYDPSGNTEPLTQIRNSAEPYALKAVVSDNAKKLAEDHAKLFIRNNKSARGGGIGTNGGIVMGEKDRDYTLKVKKDWKDTDESLKQSVTVYLKVGDTVLDPITIGDNNNWQAEFNDLPDPDTLDNVSYAVVEDPVPENFTVEYQEAVVDKENRIITIDVTNTNHAGELGNLTVTKEVTGTAGDKNKEFHFTVTLDDTSISGKYGEMTFTKGVSEITLKHNESKSAMGLPVGVKYSVKETEANADGYTTSVTNESGSIPENDTVNVTFTNHKELKANEPGKSNTKGSPKTSDSTNIGLYASLLAVSLLLLTIVLTLKKKQRVR